uniref:Uncharacterized protein n=1 Tax=Rhizophora mucronata TaxID=61149 RepID=A0A2P2MGC4_RHIMU
MPIYVTKEFPHPMVRKGFIKVARQHRKCYCPLKRNSKGFTNNKTAQKYSSLRAGIWITILSFPLKYSGTYMIISTWKIQNELVNG